MIKLRLSFDVSLSKVIMGVAGISATICAFQYFIQKNNKLKGSSKNDHVQSKTDSKRNKKVSSLFLIKPPIEQKK